MAIRDLMARLGPLGEVGRRLRGLPRTAVADAPDEAEAKIVGALRYQEEPLEAPLSGRRCACWEVVVEERAVGELGHWLPLVRRHEAQAFQVEDETGAALVEPKVWGLEVVRDHKHRTGLFSSAPSALLDFLEGCGLSTEGLGSERHLRWREGVLEAGETVAVLGPCRWAPDASPASSVGSTYREAPKRLVLGSEISGVTVSDDPRVMK